MLLLQFLNPVDVGYSDGSQWIITVVSILFSGGLGGFITLKFTKQKAQADAMASVQDVYQETITDLRTDKTLLKEERDQARADFTALAQTVEQNTKDIEAMKREKEEMKPNLCFNKKCPTRVAV
ncbi:MAG: hypothetical protein QM800_12670 [Paludibacter sp.]